MKFIIAVFVFSILALSASAQKPWNELESSLVGLVINAGITEPGSDYDDINFTDGVGLNLGVLADFLVSNSINIGFHIGYSETRGQGKPSTWSADYYYMASLIDLSIQARYKLVRYKFINGKVLPNISRVRPYIYLGLGGAIIKNSGKSLHGGEYNNMFNLPKANAGIGIEFRMTKDLSIGLQTELQSYFSDKIDGHFGRSKYNQGDDLFLATSIVLGFRHLE